MNKKNIEIIRQEIESSFTKDELISFDNFKNFFEEVDVQNAYEEDWNPKYWKKYYKKVWDEKMKESDSV